MSQATQFRSRIPAVCVLAIYAAAVACTISRHEPWADEAQAWLLARDAGLIDLWTRLLHYEGTPGLWHTLLHVLTRLGLPYRGLNIVSGAAGLAAAWMLVRHAPLPPVIRFALPFTYFLCYQYPVVARSYSLAPALLFACAALYRDAAIRVVSLSVLLVLMASVSVHALVLSFSIWMVIQWSLAREWSDMDTPARRRTVIAGTLYLLALALIVLAAWPARDVAFPFHAELTLARVFGVSAVMLGQAFTGHWIPSILVLSLSIPFLWRGRGLLLFVLGTTLLCALSVIVYWNPWSQGLLFLAWLFAMWIAAGNTQVTHGAMAALIVLPACQCYWTVRSIAYDWSYPYSGSREAAQFLSRENISSKRLYGVGYSSTAIQPYFRQNVFSNLNGGEKAAYWDWSTRNHSMDPSAFSSLSRPDYVLIGYKVSEEAISWSRRLSADGYDRVRSFEGHLFWQTHIAEAESFDLYQRGSNRAGTALASVVNMSDPAAAAQLMEGFHGLESNAWRWTRRKFSILLPVPPADGSTRVRLELRFSIPEIQIQRLGAMTLSAAVDGYRLDSQTFSRAGNYTYSREVPREALRTSIVPVAFSLDKAAPPSAADARELGAIVSSIGLYPE